MHRTTALYGHDNPLACGGVSAHGKSWTDGGLCARQHAGRLSPTDAGSGWAVYPQIKAEQSGSDASRTEHFLSLHEIKPITRRSVASRLLAVGLLLAPRLRCSCQGLRTVTRQKSKLHQVRCRPTTTDTGGTQCSVLYIQWMNPRRPQASLLDDAQISHRRSQIRCSVTKVTNSGTHRRASNGFQHVLNRTQPRARLRQFAAHVPAEWPRQ